MIKEFFEWVIGVLTTSGAIIGIGYLLKDVIGRFFTKSIEHDFEKKIEKFKSDIKEGERELEQMRTYLSSVRSERELVLQAKRFEAAENLMKVRDFINKQGMVVRYMQVIKFDELLKKINEPNVRQFIDHLIKPLKIDDMFAGYREIDSNTSSLYLSEDTLKTFSFYRDITFCAAAVLKLVEISDADVDGSKFISTKKLRQEIIELAPWTKELFERHGDGYVYFLSEYFYDQTLKMLRGELFGDGNSIRDKENATQLALNFYEVKQQVRNVLGEYGLPENLIKSDAVL